MDEETKKIVTDVYLDKYFPNELDSFTKALATDQYNEEYAFRSIFSKSEMTTKIEAMRIKVHKNKQMEEQEKDDMATTPRIDFEGMGDDTKKGRKKKKARKASSMPRSEETSP